LKKTGRITLLLHQQHAGQTPSEGFLLPFFRDIPSASCISGHRCNRPLLRHLLIHSFLKPSHFNNICTFQTHFPCPVQDGKLMQRNLQKIILFQLYTSRQNGTSLFPIFSSSGLLISFNIFDFPFLIISDNYFQWIQYTKNPGDLILRSSRIACSRSETSLMAST